MTIDNSTSNWKWVNNDEARALMAGKQVPYQTLVVRADINKLLDTKMSDAAKIDDDEELPGRGFRWFAVRERWICSIDVVLNPDEIYQSTVTIKCPFRDSLEDWESLLELDGLSRWIFPFYPIYISSRRKKGQFEIIRRERRGWNECVYLAESLLEAQRLLEYLQTKPISETYDLRKAKDSTSWVISLKQGSQLSEIGRYNSEAAAMKLAYDRSLNGTSEEILVDEDSSLEVAHRYMIMNGRVRNLQVKDSL